MKEELEWVNTLTRTTATQNKRIKKLHVLIYGEKTHVCATCPTSVRAAVRRLKNYYIENYG